MNHGVPIQRVLVVARKYWPWVDESCLRLMHLLDGWRSRRIEPTVLTGRWHSHWPGRASLRDNQVYRLLPPPRTNWNEGQFQKNVVSWIAQHRSEFDAIYVDRADGLVSAIAAKSSKWNMPLLTRFSLEESPADTARSQWLSPAAAAEACRRCDRVIVPTAFSQRLLMTHGINADRIAWIPDFSLYRADRSPAARAAASAALFGVSSGFVLPARTDLILHFGTADERRLNSVIHAVSDLLDEGLSARMWIIGAGAAAEMVYDTIQFRGWQREILLFEGFDDLQELIAVADLAIVSNPDATLQFSAPLVVSSELPMIMAANVESMQWIPETQLMKWYDSDESLGLRLREWCLHREQWQSEAKALRAHAHRHLPPESMLDLWNNLLHPLRNEARG